MITAHPPVFEAPWHAEAFAVAVALEARGCFSWSEWTTVFGAVLAEQGRDRDLNGGDDYFQAWIVALERICHRKGLASPADLQELKSRWAEAYVSTPHGKPVGIT